MKIVLITGVSSGIGFGLAQKLITENYRVIGTVRNKSKAVELQKVLGKNFSSLICDICVPEEIAEAAKYLYQIIGTNHIYALINNAGTAEIGPLLHVPIKDFRNQLDILVTGQLNVIQCFHQFLISKTPDRENGKIINISSVSGVNSNYLFGCYSAGKHAFEGLSKTLREELKIYNIKVVVVAPGNIATSIWDKQTLNIIERYKETDYYNSLKGSLNYISNNVKKDAMSVSEFTNAFLDILKEKNPAMRYTIVKSKHRRIPFSKKKLRVFRK